MKISPAPSHRSVRPALALAMCAGLLVPLAAAQSGGQAEVAITSSQATASEGGIDHAISVARRQMSRGELVAARATLKQALTAEGSMLAGPSAAEALELHKELQREIRQANPLDIALQKASAAAETGNLAEADLHLEVVEAEDASAEQMQRAAALRDEVERRRAELAPMVPEALAQAVQDFEAGRYSEAKAGFGLVRRTGVTLDEPSLVTLDSYQSRLVSLEEARGRAFAEAPGALALLQPGVVSEQDDPQPQGEPQAQPQTPDDIIAMAQAAEAQAQLRQADLFFEDGRYSEAVRLYRSIQTAGLTEYLSQEERRRLEDRLDQSLVRMGRSPAGQDPMQRLAEERDLQRQNARAEFNNALRQAERSLQSGEFTAATNAVQQARVRLEGARGVFSEAELNNLRSQANDVLSRIEAAQREAQLLSQTEQERLQRERLEDTQTQLRRTQERTVNELIDQIRAFQREMRYDEAMDAVERLLNVDPRNPTGLLLRDVISHVQLYMDYEDAVRFKQRAINRLAVDNERAAAPVPDLVNYPTDWPSITLTRGGSTQFMDTPVNRATLDSLRAPFPALAFEDHSLEQALNVVREIRADVNFDIEWEQLEAIGISRDTPVTLQLPEVPTDVALQRILGKVSEDDFAEASWAVLDGIVTISSDERIRRHRKLFMYDMRDLLHEVPDYDEVPDIDLQNVLQSQQGGGGGQSPFRDDQQDDELERRPLEERLRDIEDLITELVDPNGWEVNGGDTGKMYQFQGSLVVVNTPANHREISGLLGQLREQRAMQINVEARFLLVNQDFFERVGMDLDVYINTNNSQMRTLRATDPTIQGSDLFNFSQRPNPLRTVSGGGGDAAITQAVPAPQNGFSPIGFSQNSFGLVNSLAPTSGIAGDVLGSAPALGIAGQFLDDIQVDFLVEATQADRRSIQLTAPRLTFTNGQVANIYVATQQAFVSDLAPIVGDSAVGFDPTVSVVSEGVTLLVDGTISADRRYVQLNVDTGIARIDGFQQQAVTAVAGGELVDSSESSSFISLPTVTVTRVQTTVSVPDQGTVLLGGQRLITEFEVETGVPVLSKMPILNRFFSNRLESKEEQTLLILIKPTVLIQSEQEERNYPGLLDSAGMGFGG